MESIMNFVKGLFVKPEAQGGGINWRSLIGIGAGVAVGAFGGLGSILGQETFGAGSIGGILGGAALGLGGSALVGMIMPSGEPETGGNTAAPSGGQQPARTNTPRPAARHG